MAIVSLWYSLGCMYLMLLQWTYNADGEKLFSQSGCRLVTRMADCRNLHLSSVPQDLPSNVQEILLDFNHIEHLDKSTFQRYNGLTNLSLKSNSLVLLERDIFQDTVNLETLSLQDNTISSYYTQVATGLTSASSLKWLDLSKNNLDGDMVTTLLKKLTSLEYLYLDYNVIMRLDHSIFESLESLRELSLQGNFIYEIEEGTFDHLKKLKTLNLAYNLLPCIVDFSLIQLKVLNLSFNNIEWFLSREADVDFQLEKLDISHNQLFYFPLLPKRHCLHTLLLSDNHMKFYAHLFEDDSSFVDFLLMHDNVSSILTVNLWEGTISSNLSGLQIMDLSSNQFDYIPVDFLPNMTSLSELRLNWNCLDTFDLSHGHISNVLKNLDLSNNDLSELKIDTSSQSLPQLLYLNLSNNRLQDLPQKIFHTMNRLDTLDLSHNLIRLCPNHSTADQACIDFTNVASMRHLRLVDCGLCLDTQNVFQGMELTHLDISYNPLKGLYFLKDTVRTLKSLSLQNSSSLMDKMDFSDFLSLVSLDLSENCLTIFPESLIHLPLQYLDIRKNKLISIPLSGSHEPLTKNLNTIFLSNNLFDCCKLSWFEILRATKSISIPDLQEMTCNFSNIYMSASQLSDSVLHSCKWKSGGTLLSVLLTVPTSVTLLVALVLLFLTFKKPILKALKRRFRVSPGY